MRQLPALHAVRRQAHPAEGPRSQLKRCRILESDSTLRRVELDCKLAEVDRSVEWVVCRDRQIEGRCEIRCELRAPWLLSKVAHNLVELRSVQRLWRVRQR